MSSIAFAGAVAAYDALDAELDRIDGLDLDALSTPQRMALLDRNQTAQRRLPALQHELINELAVSACVEELGGKLSHALADRLRITRGEATRRIAEAADLASRRALTGQPLPPKLEHTAAAQRAGALSREHIRIIREFFAQLRITRACPARDRARGGRAVGQAGGVRLRSGIICQWTRPMASRPSSGTRLGRWTATAMTPAWCSTQR